MACRSYSPAPPPPQPRPLGCVPAGQASAPGWQLCRGHRSWVLGQETLAIWELVVRVKKSWAMSTGAGSKEE